MGNMKRWTCDYGAKTYEVVFDISESPYRNLVPAVMSPDLLQYYSTIDDPVVKDIADQLDAQLVGEREKKVANVVLALVQQNVRYVSDDSRFNGRDVWETPAYVLEYGVADCDGSANLYSSIAFNMGLDVVSVIVTGHMCSAVNIPGCHGTFYEFDGRRYYHMETTDNVAGAGRFWANARTYHIARPEIPSEFFRSALEHI